MALLNWKTRILIIVLIGMAAIGSVVFNHIMIKLPTGTNEEDPFFFETDRFADFYYLNGTLGGQETTYRISCDNINATHSNVTIFINNIPQGNFWVHPNGTVYQSGKCKGNYSIWWVHVDNPMLQIFQGFGTESGETFNLIDPIGLIGAPGNSYTAIVDRKRVWWPEDQKLYNILGAQASFEASLYDDATNTKVATVLMDLTCGLVELFDGGSTSQKSLTLYNTDYPISRNRLNIFPSLWIIGAVIIILSYAIMRVDWKNKYLNRLHLNADKRNETTLLMIAGLIAFGIEYIDIWFYNPLGMSGNLYLHLGYMGFLALICGFQRKRFVWLIPAFLEVAFIFAMNLAVGDPYVPHLTAFMGSTISWLCLLWVSKHDDDWKEGKTWIGKIFSKFT